MDAGERDLSFDKTAVVKDRLYWDLNWSRL